MAKKRRARFRKRFGRKPERPYAEPVVTAINLDPEQAILVSCVVGGAYWAAGFSTCFNHGGALVCDTAVKGHRTHKAPFGNTLQERPS